MTFDAKEIGDVIDLRETVPAEVRHASSRTAISRTDAAARVVDLLTVAGGAAIAAAASSEAVWVHALVATALAIAVYIATAAPSTQLRLGLLDELPGLAGGLGLATLAVSPAVLLAGAAEAALAQVLATVGLLAVARTLAYTAIRRARKRGWLLSPALVIGAGTIGCEVTALLEEHRELGLLPVGSIDDDPPVGGPVVLGGIADMEATLARTGCRHVIVAFARVEVGLGPVLRRLAERGVVVHFVPRFFDIGVAPVGPGVDDAWGIPLHRVSPLRKPPGASAPFEMETQQP